LSGSLHIYARLAERGEITGKRRRARGKGKGREIW
jgi:hypothetical protein